MPTNIYLLFVYILKQIIFASFVSNTLLALVDICQDIISKWPPLSHRLLWFW